MCTTNLLFQIFLLLFFFLFHPGAPPLPEKVWYGQPAYPHCVATPRCILVKSSQVVGLRDRVAIIRALLHHAISFPQPYAGYGDLSGVGRRRNLSEAACYRNWPRSR